MKRIFITMLIAFLLCFGSRAFAQYTFIGSGSWSSSSNWAPIGGNSGVPPDTCQVCSISINGTGPAILDVNQTLPYTSPFGGELIIQSSKTLIISSDRQLAVSSTLFRNYGTIINNGTLNLTCTLWNFDSVGNNGIIVVNPGGNLANQGPLENSGLINVYAPGNLENASVLNNNDSIKINAGAVLTNYGAGVLNNKIGGRLISNGTITNNSTLNNNEGNLNIEAGSTLNNNGTLNINESIPNLAQGTLTNNGFLYNYAGSFLNIYEGGVLYNWQPNGILQNGGTLNITGGVFSATLVNDNGNLSNNGIINIDSLGSLINIGIGVLMNNSLGIFNIHKYGSFGTGDQATMINDGNLTNDNNGSLGIATLGVLINNGLLTNNGTFQNENIYYNNGNLTNNNFFRNNILDSVINSGLLNNNGTIENEGVLLNNNNLVNSGTLNNILYGNLILNTTPANFPGGFFNWNVGSTVTIGSNGTMTVTGLFELPPGRFFVVLPGGQLIIN